MRTKNTVAYETESNPTSLPRRAHVWAGLGLLFVGFFVPPLGEIDSSVLVAYGEVSTFSGSLLGIDYRYRYRQGQHGKS